MTDEQGRSDEHRQDEDHRQDGEHRPDEIPPKEPPGRIIKPRPTHGDC